MNGFMCGLGRISFENVVRQLSEGPDGEKFTQLLLKQSWSQKKLSLIPSFKHVGHWRVPASFSQSTPMHFFFSGDFAVMAKRVYSENRRYCTSSAYELVLNRPRKIEQQITETNLKAVVSWWGGRSFGVGGRWVPGGFYFIHSAASPPSPCTALSLHTEADDTPWSSKRRGCLEQGKECH